MNNINGKEEKRFLIQLENREKWMAKLGTRLMFDEW